MSAFALKSVADSVAQAQPRAGKGGLGLVQFTTKRGNGARAMG